MPTRKSKHQEYVALAERCLEIAKTVIDQGTRITLREMAAEWLNLADAVSMQAAKNNGKGDDSHGARPTTIYWPPPRPKTFGRVNEPTN